MVVDTPSVAVEALELHGVHCGKGLDLLVGLSRIIVDGQQVTAVRKWPFNTSTRKLIHYSHLCDYPGEQDDM